ncbi:IS701 family transposase [Desulfosarcina cetonica]|uniref:IS701 family transposase n=1 Tax=Desulfosarcina cetonica TaxID=90730 RepID=UPI0006D0E316|nr:IS701 family transposase [Desulfosarcina cetonica]
MQSTQKQNDGLPPVPVVINTEAIAGTLNDFGPAIVKPVGGSDWESLWDRWVSRHHYLGYRQLLGHRLKYLAFLKDRPVAALSWSAPALKLAVRDCFIGWSPSQRKRHLYQVAANSRFLILPWVQVPNLASHVLALNIARLPADWLHHFNHRLLLLETFVDSRYFTGTCYKAANWLHVGHTQGSAKQGKGYRYHGNPKEVYLYVLDPDFRQIIDCRQQPAPILVLDRPPLTQTKVEALVMLLEHCRWHPQLTADLNLDTDDIETMAKELVSFHQCFHEAYGRIEHHRLGLAYLSGLMSNAEAKSVEPIALEFLDKKSVRSMQMFMKTFRWDHGAMLQTHQKMLAELIAAPDGMITIDPSDFPKKGKESVGVDRQYCGALGKVENCQSGVFIGYSSDKGYGLLGGRLYMPKSWFSPEQKERRQFNLVPEDLVFETKQQIALKLITEIVATEHYPFTWIGADAAFGSDMEFLNALPKNCFYFAAIKSDTHVFTKKPKVGLPPYKGRGRRPTKRKVLPGQPKPRSVVEIAKSDRVSWKPVVVAEGAKGPIIAKVARLRIYLSRDGLPTGDPQWLFLRKNDDGKIKYAISNALKEIPLSEMVKASSMRWPIEQCFQEGKSQVGMDCYEHRSWPAWHRHMIFVFLALHFMLRMRLHLKKNTFVDGTPGAKNTIISTSAQISERRGDEGDYSISSASQFHRLHVASKEKGQAGQSL